ncbi:MAG: FAD-dependent oxidoreductase, partial [Pseudomonadota bacterium]
TTESLRYQPGLLAARLAFEPPERISASRGFCPADPEALPHGFAAGFWVDMIVVDVPRYLAELLGEAAELGVLIEERRVTALSELEATVVVNCAGARAGVLAGDESVQSDWGMHVITTNPLGLEHHFMEIPALPPRWVSWMPRGDRLLIGGTSELRSDPAADPELGEALFAQAVAANPALASAEIVGFNAGLRGRREAVRVELETRAEVTMIHNYGHGGLGLTLSWGCADEVLRLLKTPRVEERAHE